MKETYRNIETKLIHSGEPAPRIEGAVVMPIFQSAMFETAGEASYHDIKYIRLNNTPNHRALHEKLAALENAESALVTASGMAAITSTLLTFLSVGDHLLVQSCLYGGTHDFLAHEFASLGLTYDQIDAGDPTSWKRKLKSSTKAIYVETLSNPLLQIPDIDSVIGFSRQHGLISLIDNTFATPINFRPSEWGFDLSLHSCSKYLNGHSDIVGGAVIGRSELIQRIILKLNYLGGAMDPHACFLLHRGLKTLAVRVKQQNISSLRLAEFLEEHPKIDRVHHPGLASCPWHDRAENYLDGSGGMLSFVPQGGLDQAQRFIAKTTLPLIAPSLGGLETLLTRPAATSHSGMSPEERAKMGITDSLIRVSVGLEAIEDIIADFRQALE